MSNNPKRIVSADRRSVLRNAAAALSLLIPGSLALRHDAQTDSDFADGALRLDLRHRLLGGAEDFTLERLRFEPQWPRRKDRLDDALDWGDYRFSVYKTGGEALLFREGFDSTADHETRSATAELSVRFPMPQRTVRTAIEKRRAGSVFQEIWSDAVDPRASGIDRSAPEIATRVDTILASGEPQAKVDLAVLGDGYQESEYPKFIEDARRAAGYLFSVEPFRTRMRDFNVYSVFSASTESGVTDPYLELRKDTVLRCAYLAGEAERTLAVKDNRALREIASAVPYDFLLVLANARRYGGSAYFGGPAVVAIDSGAAKYLVLHEFAHVIGGLAEEYYIPAAQGPAYSGNVEPWNPNVTISAGNAKWRDLLPEPAPRPTPWNKAEYEKYFVQYVKRYFRLRAARAEEARIDKLLREESRRQAALLAKNGELRRVGLFEGAHGYAKGVYRAEVNCIMFSLQTEYFCKACSSAIERMIDERCG